MATRGYVFQVICNALYIVGTQCMSVLPPSREKFRYDTFNKVVGGTLCSIHRVAFCVVLF